MRLPRMSRMCPIGYKSRDRDGHSSVAMCLPQELEVCNSLNADGRCPAKKSWRRGFERKAQHMEQQFSYRT